MNNSMIKRDRAPPYNLWHFLRSTKAGATAITAVAVSIMTVMAAGLIVDHLWLVEKRDLLKAAADAASVAATLRLRALPANQDAATVETDLQAVAERYVWLNLRANLRDEVLRQSDINLVLDINRSQGTVGIEAAAPIGRTLVSAALGGLPRPRTNRRRLGCRSRLGCDMGSAGARC